MPKAPGSWGSAAALPLAWLIHGWLEGPGLAIAALFIFLIGIWAAQAYADAAGGGDPAPVVIDEVAGQMLTLSVVPTELWLYGAGFILFRLADIWKPWPVSWADRTIKGGLGIMLDDILAAIYAGALLFALTRLIGV